MCLAPVPARVRVAASCRHVTVPHLTGKLEYVRVLDFVFPRQRFRCWSTDAPIGYTYTNELEGMCVFLWQAASAQAVSGRVRCAFVLSKLDCCNSLLCG